MIVCMFARSTARRFILFAALSISAHAQWLNFPTPGTPRTPDGKPKLTAPAPRALDGKPDLSGVWMHELTSVAEMKRLYGAAIDAAIQVDVPGMEIGTQHKYALNILLDFKPEESPMRPETQALMRARGTGTDPAKVCSEIAGIPLNDLLSEPIKIVQSPRLTVILYEVDNLNRQIYTDGRRLPKEFDLPAYLGYSAGHWEGDWLVVETAGFNNKTELDLMGHPHSEGLRITERFRRRDFGHMDVEMTFADPQMYTKPFTIKVPHHLLADADIFESVCTENEKDGIHLGKQ
jgi:hypothetical protein